uniref:Uncharacterized protein n=1 Tax=Anguilla anguilla TaxID=7936 RepID=A0A0E9R0R4_ANGAN
MTTDVCNRDISYIFVLKATHLSYVIRCCLFRSSSLRCATRGLHTRL